MSFYLFICLAVSGVFPDLQNPESTWDASDFLCTEWVYFACLLALWYRGLEDCRRFGWAFACFVSPCHSWSQKPIKAERSWLTLPHFALCLQPSHSSVLLQYVDCMSCEKGNSLGMWLSQRVRMQVEMHAGIYLRSAALRQFGSRRSQSWTSWWQMPQLAQICAKSTIMKKWPDGSMPFVLTFIPFYLSSGKKSWLVEVLYIEDSTSVLPFVVIRGYFRPLWEWCFCSPGGSTRLSHW